MALSFVEARVFLHSFDESSFPRRCASCSNVVYVSSLDLPEKVQDLYYKYSGIPIATEFRDMIIDKCERALCEIGPDTFVWENGVRDRRVFCNRCWRSKKIRDMFRPFGSIPNHRT